MQIIRTAGSRAIGVVVATMLTGCVRVDAPVTSRDPVAAASTALDVAPVTVTPAAPERRATRIADTTSEKPLRSWLGQARDRPLKDGDWRAATKADPSIPTSVAELESLRRRILDGGAGSDTCADADSDNMVCGTGDVSSFAVGLRNPALSAEDRRRLALPSRSPGATVISTAHFNVYYTPGTGAGNVPAGIAQDAANDLEAAYTTYFNILGVPIVAAGSKVTVNFSLAVNSTLPGGPINLTADYFKNNGLNRLARTATVYHEAFHLLQFVQGFTASSMYLWILESTATWAEMRFASALGTPSITGARKLTYLFDHPNLQIFDSQRYVLLPFFLFLENLCAACPTDVLISYFRTPLSSTRLPIGALLTAVGDCTGDYATFGKLLTQFGAKMAQGNWNRTPSGGQAFPTVFDASTVPPTAIEVPQLALPGTRYTLRDVGNSWIGTGSAPEASMVFFRFDFDIAAHSASTWYDVVTLGVYSGDYYSLFKYLPAGATSGAGPAVSSYTGEVSFSQPSADDPQSVYLVVAGGMSNAAYGGKACFNTSKKCPRSTTSSSEARTNESEEPSENEQDAVPH